MKPVKLIISAFGSYANVQEIDFSKLGSQGIYLITGKTGAGKTTIFDAISFALFGTTSGSVREFKEMRANHAPEKAKTYVELDFTLGGQAYNIRRTIPNRSPEALLILPSGEEINRAKDVTKKIEELLGLTQSQFAQIVMIAQNDFLKFLQSKPEERIALLRNIFKTEDFKTFQEKLKVMASEAEAEIKTLTAKFASHQIDVHARNQHFAQWEGELAGYQTQLNTATAQLAETMAEKQKISTEIAIAQEIGKKFTALANLQQQEVAHTAQAPHINALKTQATQGETALYKVAPVATIAQTAYNNYQTATQQLATATTQQSASQGQLQQAMATLQALPPVDTAQAQYQTTIKNWETATQNLQNLTQLHRHMGEISKNQDKIATLQKELASLPTETTLKNQEETTATEIKTTTDNLARLTTAQEEFATITQKRAQHSEALKHFEATGQKYHQSRDSYQALAESFRRNQAGLLADSLQKGSPCPVCGATDHPSPATLLPGTVTETQLKKAETLLEKEKIAYDQITTTCNNLKTEITTLVTRFAQDIAPLIPEAKKDNIATLLTQAIDRTKTSAQSLTAQAQVLEATATTVKDKRATLTILEAETATLTTRFLTDIAPYIATPTFQGAQKALPGLLEETTATTATLTAQKQEEENALATLTKNFEQATTAKEEATQNISKATALVEERTQNLAKYQEENTTAQENYQNALKANQFDTEESYHSALISHETLEAYKAEIAQYEKLSTTLAANIKALETELADKTPVDLTALTTQEATLTQTATALQNTRDEITQEHAIKAAILKELTTASQAYGHIEKKHQAVKQLSLAASGKLDFETYVQMAYFKRILQAANLRLVVMSQNAYSLQHKTAQTDARSRYGLDIEVFDATKGKALPTNNLSGGESFMTSLSLALGLSDIVQQTAGGTRLEAMFIDEGFGTLDEEVLELTIKTMLEMAGENRIVGIISHVAELRERIDKQIQIKKTTTGSVATVVV